MPSGSCLARAAARIATSAAALAPRQCGPGCDPGARPVRRAGGGKKARRRPPDSRRVAAVASLDALPAVSARLVPDSHAIEALPGPTVQLGVLAALGPVGPPAWPPAGDAVLRGARAGSGRSGGEDLAWRFAASARASASARQVRRGLMARLRYAVRAEAVLWRLGGRGHCGDPGRGVLKCLLSPPPRGRAGPDRTTAPPRWPRVTRPPAPGYAGPGLPVRYCLGEPWCCSGGPLIHGHLGLGSHGLSRT